MEQLPVQYQSTNNSPVARISEALGLPFNKFIAGSTDEEIKQALRYGIILLGIPEEKYGDDLAKAVLLNHIKKAFTSLTINEIRLSFEFAIEGKTDAETTLYKGEFVSAKFVSGIFTAYLEYKKKITPKKEEIKMNNIQRVTAILDLLPNDFKKSLGNIGKEKESSAERTKLPFHDVHQRWMAQFDKHFSKQERKGLVRDDKGIVLSGRWIERYGLKLNIEGYFRKKADQLQLSKERQNKL